jgi:hypothetical protein
VSSLSQTTSVVLRFPAAEPETAAAHFCSRLTFEADVADVHADIEAGVADFVLVDSRSKEAWDQGHIPSALHLPTDSIAVRAEELIAIDKLIVTNCWGPGYEYWAREGFPVSNAEGTRRNEVDPLTAPVRHGNCGC